MKSIFIRFGRTIRGASVSVAIAFLGFATPAPAAANAPTATVPGTLPTKPSPAAQQTPNPVGKHPFSISITSIDPAAPIAGQSMTVSYVVKNLAPGTVLAHVTGSVDGGLPQTVGGKPPVENAYLGNQEAKGSIAISSGTAGSVLLELTLSSTPCGAAASGPNCMTTIFASTTITVSIAARPIAPTVRVRIAGSHYADVHFRSSQDTATYDEGYYYVSHSPDCKAGYFASGNNGNDTFFKTRDLPAGASLKAVDFTLYGPPIMKSQYYKGGVGGFGSYGITLDHDKGDALHVHWENTCQGPYRDINLDYSISFEVDIPKGADLGEVATAATAQTYPPTVPDGLATISGGTSAAAATVPHPVYFKLAKNGDTYFYDSFAPANAGTISSIENDQPYPIILIASDRLGAGCTSTLGNVELAAQATTTPQQLTALYGTATLHTPKTITACAPSAPATKTLLEVMFTFLQD